MKKFLSLILALAMVICCLSFASAEEANGLNEVCVISSMIKKSLRSNQSVAIAGIYA